MLSTYLEVIKQGNVFNYYFFGSVADTKKQLLSSRGTAPLSTTFLKWCSLQKCSSHNRGIRKGLNLACPQHKIIITLTHSKVKVQLLGVEN